MTASISIPGFRQIAPVARKSHCRVKVTKRCGLPFILHKNRKRYTFVLGMVLFFCFIFIMSGFIWGIDVRGNEELESEKILSVLAQNGLHIGSRIGGLDIKEIRNDIMIQMPEIAWIGISIKGSTAHVEVRERDKKPPMLDETKAYNIIASNNGVIESINVKQGTGLVKAGDVVYKGQILVSGASDSMVKGVRYVASSADILARTWHEKSMPIMKVRETKNRTGEFKTQKDIRIFGVKINLFLNSRIPYENYDKISSDKPLKIGSFILPFSLGYDKFYEVEIVQEELNEQQAFDYTFKQLCDIIESELDKDSTVIQKYNTTWTDDNGNQNLTVTYECIESIVTMEEIQYEQNGENNRSGEDGGGN